MKTKIIISGIVCTLIMACSSENLTEAKLSDELLNVEKEVELTAVDTEHSLEVLADCHWEVSVSKSNWDDLTIQPLSGDGNGTINLRTSQNSSVSERSAILTISSRGGLKQKVTVRQTLGGATLEVNKESLEFAAVPTESQTFTVTSNSEWSILGYEGDWITVEPMSGSAGTTEVKVTAEEIQDDADRSQILTVALNNGTNKHDIKVSQEGKTNISLKLNPEELEVFEATGGTQTVNIECNARWYVDAPGSPDWLKLSTDSGTGNGQLTITCEPNKTTESRLIRIHVTSGSRTPRESTLKIEQKAATYPIITSPLTATNVTSGSASLTFGYQSMYPLTTCGICYSTSQHTPTMADTTLPITAGGASVSTSLTGLEPMTTYYVRAYMQSDITPLQTIYSDVVTITTLGEEPGSGDNPYPQMSRKN